MLCYHEIAKCDARPLTTIPYKYGFNNSAHFSTAFSRKFGFSPRQLATGKGHSLDWRFWFRLCGPLVRKNAAT
jgi:AraC-like DNA-binding protein